MVAGRDGFDLREAGESGAEDMDELEEAAEDGRWAESGQGRRMAVEVKRTSQSTFRACRVRDDGTRARRDEEGRWAGVEGGASSSRADLPVGPPLLPPSKSSYAQPKRERSEPDFPSLPSAKEAASPSPTLRASPSVASTSSHLASLPLPTPPPAPHHLLPLALDSLGPHPHTSSPPRAQSASLCLPD